MTKAKPVNDLDLKNWKDYEDLLTDSLWLIDRRDSSGEHLPDYHGNFVPQIPNQFLTRFTRKNDWVLDAFSGSGTTLIECRRLGRNGLGIELQKKVAALSQKRIDKEKGKTEAKVLVGDSATFDLSKELKARKLKNVQFIFWHPPYHDIIQFSKSKYDLSNAQSTEHFLNMLGTVVDNTLKGLEPGRHAVLVLGDKYTKGEWVPLGFLGMQVVQKQGMVLKSVIVKNFEETKAKRNQRALWRYRALAGGYFVFKHEYIFLFQKPA